MGWAVHSGCGYPCRPTNNPNGILSNRRNGDYEVPAPGGYVPFSGSGRAVGESLRGPSLEIGVFEVRSILNAILQQRVAPISPLLVSKP